MMCQQLKTSFPNVMIDISSTKPNQQDGAMYQALLHLCQCLSAFCQLEAQAADHQILSNHALWLQFEQDYHALLDKYCTSRVRRSNAVFGTPPRYQYIHTGCHAFIHKKRDDKAQIECKFSIDGVHYQHHQFTLVKQNGVWLIDKFRRYQPMSGRYHTDRF